MPGEARLTLATSQFPVTGSITENAAYICRHIVRAAEQNADVVLFPEAALTGYAGVDFTTFDGFDWLHLRDKFQEIQEAASRCRCWVLLGSAHYLSRSRKPTNCVYVIDSSGRIRTRYDKSMLYKSEQDHYTAGNSPTVFRIGSVKCGVLVCFDSCFPDLFAHLESERIRILFHSYYNAGNKGPGNMDQLIPSQARARAFDNSYMIVGSNSSRRHSAAPSFIAGPDGRFSTLKRHVPGVLVEAISADDFFWKFRRESSPAIRRAWQGQKRAKTHPRIKDKQRPPRAP